MESKTIPLGIETNVLFKMINEKIQMKIRLHCANREFTENFDVSHTNNISVQV